MTAMLASVRTLDEAMMAFNGGADLIDLKEPSRGALGALDHAAVRVCVRAIGGRRPVSATIGDQPEMDPDTLVDAVTRMGATGVDYIKIGIFRHARAIECVRALDRVTGHLRLVGVVFAEDPLDVALVDAFAHHGFAGAMIDTARKTGRSLRDWKSVDELTWFVRHAASIGLLAGLAGSLRAHDIAPLLALDPDYLGFRGALCGEGDRVRNLDASRFSLIRDAIPRDEKSGRRQSVAA